MKRLHSRILTGLSLSFLATPCLLAAENTSLTSTFAQTLEQKQRSWSQLNYYSPTEGYHSKGSFGLHLGLGALAPTAPSHDAVISEDDRAEMKETRPRFFISKGTAWPVDFGASFSLLQRSKNAMQGGAHIQWTVYEGFQMPSVALRASRSMLSQYQEVKSLTSDAVEIGISYGIIRYVILSAGIRQQWDKGETQAKADYLSLIGEDLPNWTKTRTIYSWGVNISPFTPFVQIGLEQSYWDKETQVSLAKLSFLL